MRLMRSSPFPAGRTYIKGLRLPPSPPHSAPQSTKSNRNGHRSLFQTGVWRGIEQTPPEHIVLGCVSKKTLSQEFDCQLFIWEVNLESTSGRLGSWDKKGRKPTKSVLLSRSVQGHSLI